MADRVEIPQRREIENRPSATWNSTQLNDPEGACITQFIQRQAAAAPEAVALVMGDQALSYRELNERANQLAHHLQAGGVGPDVLVGVCIERSLEMVVGLLAVLKAGGAYVPLDPANPDERLSFMLNETRVAVLVTRQHIAARLSVQGTPILCVDADGAELTRLNKDDPVAAVTADHLAYVIYTSGSTGQPKGVQITRRSLSNLVLWHQQAFGVTPVDRASHFFSPGFDVAGEELWPHLASGASVYVVEEDIRFDPPAMRDWLVKRAITIAMLPTGLAESLLALEWPPTTSLRLMLAGGEALRRYPPASLPFALINNYGPTETTVVATCGRVLPDASATTPPSIGRPIANVQVYLLDEHMRQVPIGAPGELHIGGVGVARGYLHRPSLDAEQFLADPFSNEPGARLYRTGDRARALPDGQIAFLGRTDFQIKIRSYRIEPNEITQVLNRHPAIATSIVVAREDTPGDKRLMAYLTLVPGEPVSAGALRSALLQQVPEYMVPPVFVALDEFPLNANGKVDRSALPLPTAANTLRDADRTAAGTPTEERLVEIVASLLGLEQVGIQSNFFALGGHSLQATQLHLKIAETFGVEVPVPSLFEVATLRELAVEIERLILARLEMMSDEEVTRLLH